MFKHLSVLPVFAALLIGTACRDDISTKTGRLSSAEESKTSTDKDRDGASGAAATSSSADSEASASEKIPATGDFELALDDVVTQAAPWGDVEISVQKARLLRGAKPAGFPSDVKHSNKTVYAILDLQLEAKGSTETDYRTRDTWDLLLANDKRIKPLNPVGKLLLPGDESKVSLFYEVSADASLSGASLEINGSDRDVLEPLRVPLDEEKAFESQVELPEIVGESFEPDDDSAWSFEIVDANYGVNLLSSGRRAPRDERLVELTVRVQHDGDASKSFRAADAPRLSIGQRSITPEGFDLETMSGGESHDFVMVYAIDEDASKFELIVDTGDDVSSTSVDLPSLLGGDDSVTDDESDTDSFADDESDSDSFDTDSSDDGSSGDERCSCQDSASDDSGSDEDRFDSDENVDTNDSFTSGDDDELDSDEVASDDDDLASDDDGDEDWEKERN